MRYVIMRDDDTNALTPVECLERLYRPLLDLGLPVNLAVIPNVRTDTRRAGGKLEGFLPATNGEARPVQEGARPGAGTASSPLLAPAGRKEAGTQPSPPLSWIGPDGDARLTIPVGENAKLVQYLLDNAGYHIAQHGCYHSLFEFDVKSAVVVSGWLEQGRRLLLEAGFQRPQTFVAPYDRFSRASLAETAKQFRVISTGWFELRRLPYSWWPLYSLKRLLKRQHWRAGRAILLAHPGCLLSRERPRTAIFDTVKECVLSRRLTVLVTHWWEYFSGGRPDEPFIEVLHETGNWLARQPEVKVISFDDVAQGTVPLN